jgi:hypothetical protein
MQFWVLLTVFDLVVLGLKTHELLAITLCSSAELCCRRSTYDNQASKTYRGRVLNLKRAILTYYTGCNIFFNGFSK